MYIIPGESKGELEFAMGRIGWAVLGGYTLGSLRGILPELRNPNTRQLVRIGFIFVQIFCGILHFKCSHDFLFGFFFSVKKV